MPISELAMKILVIEARLSKRLQYLLINDQSPLGKICLSPL
jgi:hypothetical protein